MYFNFCQDLYSNWNNCTLNYDPALESFFDLNALPEPYLSFKSLENPLYFLTTNPGGVMEFQKRDNFNYSDELYSDLAHKLGERYLLNLDKIGTQAVTRIKRMIQLSELVKKSGVIQVEAIPYHSKNFNNKSAFLKCLTDFTLIAYINHLKDHLTDKPVLSIQAGSPDLNRIKSNDWILFLCDTMNLDIDKAHMYPIKVKTDGKVTIGMLWDNRNRKGIIFNNAINSFPGDEGILTIAKIINNDAK